MRRKDRVVRAIHCTTFVGKLRKGLFGRIIHELFHFRCFLKVSSLFHISYIYLFHNMYSHICFADILLRKHFPVCNFLIVINLINQFTIIYNHILVLFDKMKITLSILFNNWVNRRKRIFFC